jgi:two-component system cell cycle sensor histidine kinase/response regulator CckA
MKQQQPPQKQPQGSFFREKVSEQRSIIREKNIKALVLFAVSIAYGLFAIFIIKISKHQTPLMSIMSLYAYGVIGCFVFLHLKQRYTDSDRGRRILTEVLEKSAEARAITDPEGETIYANARFNILVGDTQQPASLPAFSRLFDVPQKIEKALHELKARAAPDGSATTEFHTRLHHQQLWFQVTCQHITGWPGFVHWRFDDISPRYHMEAAIREEREKLRDFTDNAPVGFFSVNAEGKFLFANDTLLQLLKIERHALLEKKKLHDFLVNPPKNARPCDFLENGGFNQRGELLMKDTEGQVFKAGVTHSITVSEDHGLISRSIIYDLTSEQNMQQKLRESEDRFERLFEEAPVGICMLSADGIISDANQKLAAILHQPINVINGRPLVDYIGKEAQKSTQEWLQRVARDDRAKSFIEVPLKGGKEVITQLYARRFSGSDDFVMHFIDLTEQKNLEKQFTQSQKMQAVGQLAGGIAHDFNNLLTAMIGFCDLLLLRHKPGDPSFADIMQIKQNANRAANLVRQLLAFSRQQTLQPRVLDITDVLTELSHLLRRLIGSNIELTMEHGSDLGLIKADQGQMEQVLINLVVNARDAMPQGGKLYVRTHNHTTMAEEPLSNEEVLPPGDWITIAIKDSGTGIKPDVLSHIFEPFFSTKDVGAGTGLGLATVHGIVHQTGGYISVRTMVGKGTTFTIYLPRHTEIASEKPVVTIEEKPVIHDLTGSSKILLVEDEDAVRVFSARALTNKGYQVIDAPSGAIALQLLEEKKVDPEVLITDVMMPEMDGTTLAQIVREKYPHVKIIFISGYAEDKFKEHLGDNVYFLPKPFTLKQLATKVKEVIEGRS